MSEHEMYSYDLNSTHYPTAPSASGLSDADEIVARELMALNPAQQEGAMTVTGPVLVIAGAGSGKTKMLTARIINLMASYHVPGSRILAVTFTNKAAGEMRERISRALGLSPDSRSILGLDIGSSVVLQVPMVGTFHSVCTRILRRELLHTPFAQQFVIYDDSEQLSVIKECFQKLQISDAAFSPKAFQYAINQAKCAAKEPNDITNPANPFEKNLVRVYALYQQEMFTRNAIDFGEIITLTYRVLKNNPELLKKYQEQFQFIHVDEYQDTNHAQYLLINILAQGHKNLCVVGDEDQSIYRWRGADIRNILEFERDYPEARVVKLEQNYRSTQTIINASSHVIANNTSRLAKTLWTDNPRGDRIQKVALPDERAEAELVVQQIKAHAESAGYSFRDVAIFYRTNAQSRVFEDVFNRERIPYQVVGGLRFYDRKEIKDVLAYFRVVLNGADSVSVKRIINVPARAIGKTTIDKIDAVANQQNITFESALHWVVRSESSELGSSAKKKIAEFIALITGLRKLLTEKTIVEFYHELLDRTQYVLELKKENTEEAQARIENLQELESMLSEFEEFLTRMGPNQNLGVAQESLPLFVENVTLVGEKNDASAEEDAAQKASGKVSLMTLHTSKGLEFPLVFMVGCEEGLFPSIRPHENETLEDIEEERRLCYVGMTRAKQKLFMTSVVCRRIYGNIMYQKPSRFFEEIPEEFLEVHDFTQRAVPRSYPVNYGRASSVPTQPRQITAESSHASSRFKDDFSQVAGADGGQIVVGCRVKHPQYGIGVVHAIDGHDENAKLAIEFASHGLKKFIAKFAKLTRI